MIRIKQFTFGQPNIESLTLPYLDLIKRVGWNERDSDKFSLALRSSLWVAAAFSNKEYLGGCRLVGDGIYNAILYDLVVLPEFQRQGIGYALIKAALIHCCHLGVHRLECISAPESVGFYNKNWYPVNGYYLMCKEK